MQGEFVPVGLHVECSRCAAVLTPDNATAAGICTGCAGTAGATASLPRRSWQASTILPADAAHLAR